MVMSRKISLHNYFFNTIPTCHNETGENCIVYSTTTTTTTTTTYYLIKF